MPEEQLNALIAKLKDDAGLREIFKGAADLDAAVIVKATGFDVHRADWLKYQENHKLELGDEELEGVAGGAEKRGSQSNPFMQTDETLSTCSSS